MTSADHPVLLVEDDEYIAELVKFMLEREGNTVVCLSDGLAAKAYIEANAYAPKLIMLDVMLPHADGFELVQLIRSRAGWGEVPIIMLTAKTQERDIVRALDAGANDYIVKPFQPIALMARIRRLLAVAQ